MSRPFQCRTLEPNIRQSLATIDDEGLELWPAKGDIDFFPAFRRTGEVITSPQARYFGFYALRSAIRGILMSINFLLAGRRSFDAGLHGPAVTLYYTAAYHAAESLLVFSGRVWVDLELDSRSRTSCDCDVVLASLSRKTNVWTFEKRRRSHVTRWLEFRPALALPRAEIPPYFHRLFDYLFRFDFKELPTSEDMSRFHKTGQPGGERYALVDQPDEFLRRIPEVRHIASYHALGSDRWAAHAEQEAERARTKLGRGSHAMGDFATSTIEDASSRLVSLLDALEISSSAAASLSLSVQLPWFDEPLIDLLDPNLATKIERIRAVLA